MRLNSLNRDMFKPFCSHNGLLGWVFGCVLEDLHRFLRGFLQRDASMRALWSDRQNCSHNVSQKVKRIRRFSDLVGMGWELPNGIPWSVNKDHHIRSDSEDLAKVNTHLSGPPDWKAFQLWRRFPCEPSDELQESPGPAGPEVPKKSEKSLPGPPALGSQKVWKKSW